MKSEEQIKGRLRNKLKQIRYLKENWNKKSDFSFWHFEIKNAEVEILKWVLED